MSRMKTAAADRKEAIPHVKTNSASHDNGKEEPGKMQVANDGKIEEKKHKPDAINNKGGYKRRQREGVPPGKPLW